MWKSHVEHSKYIYWRWVRIFSDCYLMSSIHCCSDPLTMCLCVADIKCVLSFLLFFFSSNTLRQCHRCTLSFSFSFSILFTCCQRESFCSISTHKFISLHNSLCKIYGIFILVSQWIIMRCFLWSRIILWQKYSFNISFSWDSIVFSCFFLRNILRLMWLNKLP